MRWLRIPIEDEDNEDTYNGIGSYGNWQSDEEFKSIKKNTSK